jgi:hypothetical protein
MRLERLVVASGERTLATDLHPGLTVVGGLTPAAREALVGELLDGLTGSRPGVHVELVLGGRPLAVFRPAGGRHRVIDTGSVADVTSAHAGADGEIDLFAALGVDRAVARRTMRLGREDLVPRGESEAWIARLAAADPERLWDTAMRCRAAEHLVEAAAAGGLTVDDAPIVEELEQRHATLVEATDTYDRIRLIALTIATVGALGAVGMANVGTRAAVVPFMLVALAGVALAIRYRWAVEEAARAERAVLRRAGADDYTTFHYERVSALLDTDRERRRFMQAVGDHRRAMQAWGEVAGPVPLHFALEHEHQIRDAAELRERTGALRGPDGLGVDTEVASELVGVLAERLRAVRSLTGGDEVLPVVVDDALSELDPSVSGALLHLLAERAAEQQVVVVTADEAVVAWARTARDAGADLALVEPSISVGTPDAPEVRSDGVPAGR